MTKLADTVVLDPTVNPTDVERALIDAVNLGWQHGGNDGRCNVPANFVGWALEEIERQRAGWGEAFRIGVAKQEENERLRAAMTPSAETKAAYIGEFHIVHTEVDEFGDERNVRVAVPWDVVKEIMAAIRKHAALR